MKVSNLLSSETTEHNFSSSKLPQDSYAGQGSLYAQREAAVTSWNGSFGQQQDDFGSKEELTEVLPSFAYLNQHANALKARSGLAGSGLNGFSRSGGGPMRRTSDSRLRLDTENFLNAKATRAPMSISRPAFSAFTAPSPVDDFVVNYPRPSQSPIKFDRITLPSPPIVVEPRTVLPGLPATNMQNAPFCHGNNETLEYRMPAYQHQQQTFFDSRSTSGSLQDETPSASRLPLPDFIPQGGVMKESEERRKYLNLIFSTNKFPNGPEKEEIARRLNMTVKSVNVWFQNKRHSFKQKMVAQGFHVPRGRGRRGDLNKESYEREFRPNIN